MSKTSYTKSQSDIIHSEADKILVSASAGTGKTFVMVERIIDLLVNKNRDIDNFLIVTFTKASAEEMRGRIYSALHNELSTEPKLKKQLKKLPTAAISTLHSFCSDLIKRYFYAADLPPKFKVLDDVRADVMKKEVLEDLLDDLYEKGDESFLRLSEILAPKRRDDGFIGAVIQAYAFAQSLENPEEFLSLSKKLKQKDLYLDSVSPKTDAWLESSLELFCEYFDALKKDGHVKPAENCSTVISAIKEAISKTHFEEKIYSLYDGLSLSDGLIRLSAGKIGKTAAYESFSAERKAFADKVREYKELADAANDTDAFGKVSGDVATFCDITQEFAKRYRAEKDKSAYLDFSDLEHFALKLLKSDEVIKDIREKYKYVFVDEYQDTSKVQEALIKAISFGNNLFVVGDLKQSIYGFRQCDMSIFAEKEQTFGKTTSGEVHYLNTNFRSAKTILDFVNELFSSLMTKETGIDYENTSKFQSLKNDEGEIELDLICVKAEKEIAEPKIYSVAEDDNVDTELLSSEIEGRFIADKIKSLVGREFFDGKIMRTLTYGDIAVLSRDISSAKSSALYRAVLNEGIPVTASASGTNLFDYAEVVQAASFLKVLQNYKNDVPLLSVLKSPFFSFTDAELYEIKQSAPKTKFFHEALFEARLNGSLTEKVSNFFATISKYKNVALARGGIYALKKAIVETPFECVTLSKFNGKKKLELVNDFITKISSIDDEPDLPNVINAIEILNESLKASDSSSPDGTVSFMTIHKSKGLEFPVVFLSNLAKKTPNITAPVLCDKDLGIAMKAYDVKNRQKKNSLPYIALSEKKKRESQEEDLRILYVALTRAKSKLFLTGVKKYKENFPESLEEAFGEKPSKSPDMLEIICRALMEKNGYAKISLINGETSKALPERYTPDLSASYPLSEKAIENNIDFSYAYQTDTLLPTKFVASNLKCDFFVEEEVSYKLPDIYSDDKIALGTAYHKLLEKAKPLATKEKVSLMLKDAVAKGEIDMRLESEIDIDAVSDVLNLPIMKFGKAYTEKPFMTKAPAKLFTDFDTDREVLVQGVIDLLLVNGNEAIVIDFKYTSEENPAILRKRYAPQLSAYAYAVECGLSLKVVKKALINLKNFELVEI